jgi:hypothetical protein
VISLAEFEGRWDPRRYLDRQARRLADDPAYPPGLYVPQRFSVGYKTSGDDVGSAMWWAVKLCRFEIG